MGDRVLLVTSVRSVHFFFFSLLLIVVAKHRHNYTWLVCFAGQIKLKLKTKVHNRQCFFVHFIQPNMVLFWECNSLNCSIQMNKRTNTSNSPTIHKKQVQQSFFFWCVTNKRRCSFMVLFRFFLQAPQFEGCFVQLPWTIEKKKWRKTNASNAVALNLFLSLCIFLQSNGSTHCVYSVMDNKRYILPVPTLLFLFSRTKTTIYYMLKSGRFVICVWHTVSAYILKLKWGKHTA